MLFDSQNRLLVTTDTTKSAAYSVNTSSGNATLINTTTIDYINSIEEDLQGNFYATSWGDSYFYRMDKDFKNAKDLALYSKPTGLYFNKMYDVIALACSNCNKVEFHKLHMVYINDVDTAQCPGDSFNVNINAQYKGKGTYLSGNTFYVDLSDGNGKFSGGTVIGMQKTTTEPGYFRVVLPKGKRFYGSNFKIRIRSTNPVFYSINEMEVVVPFVPTIYVSDKDTVIYCSSNPVKLGKARDEDSILVNYLWYMDGNLQSNKTSQIDVNQTGIHKFQLVKQPKDKGCSISASVITNQKSGSISIPFKDTLWVCQRQNATIGGDSIANTSIRWTDKSDTGFLQTKYKFEIPGNVNININKTFTATVRSIQLGCEISKDVSLIYKNNPKYQLNLPKTYEICYNSSLSLLPKYVSGDTQNISFKWEPNDFLDNPHIKEPVYTNTLNQNYKKSYSVWTKDTLTKCLDSFSVQIQNKRLAQKPILEQTSFKSDSIRIKNIDNGVGYMSKVVYLNDSVKFLYGVDSIFAYPDFKNAKYIIVFATYWTVCTSVSDTLFLKHLVSVNKVKLNSLTLYPNPASDKLFINNPKGNLEHAVVIIYNLVGQNVLVSNISETGEINISSLRAGIYSVRVNFEGRIISATFIKK